ncbi:homoserine O-succinyltransferase [Vibrio chagasii]|nr:homoserine O-succinyltransferase [Vibrio chagasii]
MVQFEDVIYWDHLKAIMEWANKRYLDSLCALGCSSGPETASARKHLPKRTLQGKLSGVYNHEIHNPYHPILRGLMTPS